MKIGVLGPIWHNIPPNTYGGTEDVVYNLVNGLVNNGHAVTLFGPKTAQVYAQVYPTVDVPLREKEISWTNVGYPLVHITEAFDHADEFDIMHVHLNKIQDYISLPLSLHCSTPVLFTIHFKITDKSQKSRYDRYLLLNKYRALPFSSISNSQVKDIKLNHAATVYNGVDLKRFHFSDKKGSYLVWLGKVNPFYGPREAILAAKQAKIRIYLMGSVDRGVAEMADYYDQQIKPLVDDKQVIWLGEVSHNEKTSILSGAKAFLNPIQWEEPFGLVMVESLAVGTPVISYRRGAASEIIRDGETGFLVNDLDEMVDKITQVEHLDRGACRESIEENFTIEKMVRGYEATYETTIRNWGKYKKEQKKLLSNLII